MKRKAVLENLARNVYRQYRGKRGEQKLRRYEYESYLKLGGGSTITRSNNAEIVIFKLEFKEMKREMFSGIDFGEYDQQTLYGSIRQEYLEAPIWCRARNAGDYLVEYMMVKDGGNYVQVEIRNFDLPLFGEKKC